MPGFDQSGPLGQGPNTGRGMGPCGRGMRMGLGRERGYGRGLGRYFGWNAPLTKEEKLADAESYRKALQEEMEETDKELADLRK